MLHLIEHPSRLIGVGPHRFFGVLRIAIPDGVQDAGELGLEGLTINLVLPDGSFVRSDVTDPDGRYQFDNLDAGDYGVGIKGRTIPDGATPTYTNGGVLGNDTDVTVSASEQLLTIDFHSFIIKFKPHFITFLDYAVRY